MLGSRRAGRTWIASHTAGALVALVLVAAATAVIFPLAGTIPVLSLGYLYLVAVLVVAAGWGLPLGLATAVASAAAFNYFHIEPIGRFTIARAQDSAALIVYLTVAVVAST